MKVSFFIVLFALLLALSVGYFVVAQAPPGTCSPGGAFPSDSGCDSVTGIDPNGAGTAVEDASRASTNYREFAWKGSASG